MDSLRDRLNAFVARHIVGWELVMAGLAVAYVVVGFATDDAPPLYRPTLAVIETLLTVVFVAEFMTRILASRQRWRYLKSHAIDLVALMPIARGVRVARLLRLLRLVRAFAGVRRVMTNVERLSRHHDFGTLVIGWFATMLLCSWAFYLAENDVNPLVHEMSDALWWGLSTLTGGTTDIRAVTDEGRIAGAVLLVVGVALFTAITGVFISYLLSHDRTPGGDPVAQLERLVALRDRGELTMDEFARMKSKVVAD